VLELDVSLRNELMCFSQGSSKTWRGKTVIKKVGGLLEKASSSKGFVILIALCIVIPPVKGYQALLPM
jgi:hypothetical protein